VQISSLTVMALSPYIFRRGSQRHLARCDHTGRE
jgi:hypothetical protein